MSIRTVEASRLTVAELAAAVGVGPDTIRYYERAGLLPAPDRRRRPGTATTRTAGAAAAASRTAGF
jgi:hypothetical protein